MEILFTSLAFGLGFGAGVLAVIGFYFIFTLKKKEDCARVIEPDI